MFGLSYIKKLRTWRDRFLGALVVDRTLGFDDRFRRMWEMYLAYCEGGFRAKSIVNSHPTVTPVSRPIVTPLG